FTANIQLGLPVKGELTRADTVYAVTADLNGFAAEKLVMNQKLEANNLKIVANNQGYQVKGDVKINGQAAALDYRKLADGDADGTINAARGHRDRRRWRFHQGFDRGRPERRPHERELPDLLAVRRRQDLVEGGTRPGRRGEGHHAR